MGSRPIQVEDGEYTRIHNAILEALAKARLSGSEFRCVFYLLRKTYGWNKKEDKISLSQWAEGTDTKRNHVIATLNGLVEKKIMYRVDGYIPTYGFNKHVEEWQEIGVNSDRGNRFCKVLPKQVTVTKAGNSSVTKAGNKTVTKAGTHKRQKTIKDNGALHPQMFTALVTVCRLDPKLKAGHIAKTAKSLLDAGYLPEDVDSFKTWWSKNDFRGRRGEPPTLGQVVEKIMQAKQETHPAPKSPESVTIVLPDGTIQEATT
jgi:phage replication O-like protein O